MKSKNPRKSLRKNWMRPGLIYLSGQNSFICSLPKFFLLSSSFSGSFTCLLWSLLLLVILLPSFSFVFYVIFLWVSGTITFNFTYTFYYIFPLTVFEVIILYSFTFSWFSCLKPLLFSLTFFSFLSFCICI